MRLLKIGATATVLCLIILAVLAVVLRYDVSEPLMILLGVPFLLPFLYLAGPLVHFLLWMKCMMLGIPTDSVTFAYQKRAQLWREALGTLLILGAIISLIDAASVGALPRTARQEQSKKLPTLSEAVKTFEAERAKEEALANEGNPAAQYSLGAKMFDQGKKVEGVQWFRKAAEQGNADAEMRLGFLYYLGDGVTKDDSEAAVWLRKAAEQGNAKAEMGLGASYAGGFGVQQNDAEAAKWYRAAAEQGDIQAQNELGVLFAEGKGVTLNYEDAYFWLILASAGGVSNAVSMRSFVESHLTPEQVSAIQKRARDWKPTPSVSTAQ